jgi:hypothetical protein
MRPSIEDPLRGLPHIRNFLLHIRNLRGLHIRRRGFRSRGDGRDNIFYQRLEQPPPFPLQWWQFRQQRVQAHPVGSRHWMLLVQGLECFLLRWKAGFRSWMTPIHGCQVVALVSTKPSQLWRMAGAPPKPLRQVPCSCSNSASSTNFWISGSAGGDSRQLGSGLLDRGGFCWNHLQRIGKMG